MSLLVCILSCQDGEEPDEDCDECNLVNICERDSPCDNGGACSLDDAPDNYTCDCIDYYTGQNCSGIHYLLNIMFPVTCIPLECSHTCSDGYMVTATCDGCQLNDTCIANTPCQHGSTCTLNGSPDEYVCTCTGYYDGKNCEGNL